MSESSKPMDEYESRYGDILQELAKATGELTAANDLIGIRFLIECCDAVLGRALLLLETKQNEGKVN